MTSGDFPTAKYTDDPGPARSRSWLHASVATVISLTLVALAVAAIAVGLGSLVLYEKSGAFWPEAIPPYVQYLGEDYRCFYSGAVDMGGLTVQGHTIGGGRIYARPPIGTHASEGFVVVTDGDGHHQVCTLAGP